MLTLRRALWYCHNVLTLSLAGQPCRFCPRTFTSYWWWYARAEGAIR
jgi:hypothetical protein